MLIRATLAAALLGLLAAGSAEAVQSKPVDCELAVDGKTYIKGRCDYFPAEGGSFQISGGGYFAQLDVTGKDVGEANWNESPGSTHAQSYLGTVKRKGACWSNTRTKICARALSDAETKAALAKQADGMMLYPDFAPTACIGVEGPLADGATPVLHTCNVPPDLMFDAAADGTLSINKHPELCIDVEAPGMSKPPQLVLLACQPNSPKWRWTGKGTDSGIVKSSDGQCWAIPQTTIDRNESFPWVINLQPCAKADAVKLNLSKD